MISSFIKNAKTLVGTLLAVNVVIVGAWLFLFLSVQKENANLVAAAEKFATQKEKEERAIFLHRFVRDTEDDAALLSNYFVTEENAIGFLERIEKFAEHAHVQLEKTGVNKNDQRTLSLDLRVQGGYTDIVYFFTLLEHLPLKVTIQNLTIEAADPGVQDGGIKPAKIWQGNFTLLLQSFVGKP